MRRWGGGRTKSIVHSTPMRRRGGLQQVEQRGVYAPALDLYADRLGLDEEVRACLERTLPGFMAGMSERNWDYSRPQWVRRQFGLA